MVFSTLVLTGVFSGNGCEMSKLMKEDCCPVLHVAWILTIPATIIKVSIYLIQLVRNEEVRTQYDRVVLVRCAAC